MKIKLLCTLGPTSLTPGIITGLAERGVHLFRLNLSHTPLEQVSETIALVRRYAPSTPLSLDTEGPQVRCGPVAADLALEEGKEIRLVSREVMGTRDEISLRPQATFDALRPGSLVSIDFDGVVLRVTDAVAGHALATVVVGGRIKSNRGAAVEPPPVLPSLTEKDRQAIDLGVRSGVEHYSLSFTNSAEDIALIRGLIPSTAYIMSKIESRAGVRNMDGIIEASDAVVIDRGDLSREVPLEYVPYYQKAIIRRANRWNRPVFVATNLLESMVSNRRPTIAESNDIANTLIDGVHGLVLAAETAIGMDPLGTVDMIARSIQAFERSNLGHLIEEDRPEALRSLIWKPGP